MCVYVLVAGEDNPTAVQQWWEEFKTDSRSAGTIPATHCEGLHDGQKQGGGCSG